MSTVSDKQLAANQQNALLGGPKTPEGKAIVAKNAIKYGIFVKDAVVNAGLVQESAEEFETLGMSFFEALAPENEAQEELVRNIVFNVWRKRRLVRAETGEIKIANAYLEDAKDAEQIHNNESTEMLRQLYSPEASLKDTLNNRLQIKNLVEAMESACYEYEDKGVLSDDTFKTLLALFRGDSDFYVPLQFVRAKAVDERDKQGTLACLKNKLTKLKDRQQYLETRDMDQKRNISAANFVPDLKTVDKFLKYAVSIDKQIKNDLELLRALKGEREDPEKVLPANA